MSDAVSVKSGDSAEKAYAAASEAVSAKVAPDESAAVEFPSKAKRKAKAPAATPAAKKTVSTKKSVTTSLKEAIMSSKTAEPVTAAVQEALADVQTKAKEAFTKSSALFSEAGEFTKGNVEALIESGKILANGVKDLAEQGVAEGKAAVETVTADFKALTAVKSPTDFVKLQGDIARRNLDQAIAMGTKNGEAMMKLASDVFAPLSGRFKLAIEKAKKAA